MQDTTAAEAQQTTDTPQLESEASKIEALTTELEKSKELVSKLRKFEKENKSALEAAIADSAKYQQRFSDTVSELDKLKSTVRSKVLSESIEKALIQQGAVGIGTAAKLLDTTTIEFSDDVTVDTASLEAAVEKLKQSDPVLFGSRDDQSQVPKPTVEVKRAAEVDPVGGYEKEIRAAKTQKDIINVMKKYGKIV
jgi:hypothetical protein